MKHWLEHLDEYGNPVERKADYLKAEYTTLERLIKKQVKRIQDMEDDALHYVKNDWTPDEIKEAKEKGEFEISPLILQYLNE